ncbi:hypothetical protein JTE90_005748 [Oedothorax gibbosus]|uniref:Uncharacterized protein n=1 Tax=Oedothorax gibbosus TaxID=931172 RepID=A0AAV6UR77_9ARAC|nr:hypothetical protein JTE90_005748 [Oedothorax gibbosus]
MDRADPCFLSPSPFCIIVIARLFFPVIISLNSRLHFHPFDPTSYCLRESFQNNKRRMEVEKKEGEIEETCGEYRWEQQVRYLPCRGQDVVLGPENWKANVLLTY